ncbi:peptidylprolyl isomerase [Borrelia miyamotoi]|uniref:Peptidyl-prolyl cis-trans isomerase n=1 Tax=Borrelia miyamotoi TaxID=47466 RepID=A0AAQ2WX58_9SPIR|nr:hypothetical protein [Borrelia miyamotoi]AGT27044.1 hypothetical protein I871_00205 [Borrelia miyamotoi LB-2001]AJA58255.1 hypothetical protein RJ61_00190 [Borrelia miyamotoi]AOW95331.1 hypothetical protein AXH25_00190 [Borrelia miyamotoi]QTL83209.1 peptidyl-prolyl cis-trans isomerase [Borrelia miyamotoi]WAZ85505.1 peptidyl-prolyl cis-trans isomerase [Borrelia miyamotoi]
MHKRVKHTKEVLSKIDVNDRRIGKWGLLALILIVFGFIIAPLMPGLFDTTNSSKLKFGSYKGQPIYYEKDNIFAKYVNYYSNAYSNLKKDNNFVDMEYFIWNLAFKKYIEDIAFLDLAKDNGFYISKSILNKNLINSPVYLDSNGSFSPKRYKKVSDYQRFKTHSEAVEKLLSSNIQVLLSSSFILSNSLLNAIKTMSEVRKNVVYIVLSYQDFPRDEIISYVDKNPTLFKSIDIASVRFKNLNDAGDAYEKLSKGMPFEEVAKFYSEDMTNFKGIASFKKYYFDLDLMLEKKEDLDAIFSLKMNEFTNPIKSKNGSEYEIYKALSDVYDFNKNSEHDISSVRKYIETYEPSIIETFLESKLNIIRSEINSGELQQVLKNYKLALKEDIVNLAYNMNVYPTTLKELSVFSNSKDFYDIIFNLQEGQWSKPFLADRRVYLFSLRSAENYSANSDNLMKEDRIFDNLYQANNKLVLDYVLNKNDFKDNFYEAFFSLRDFSLKMNN